MQEKISLIFPVYNEEENIKPLYRQVKDTCASDGVDYEMIFVDDGSTDNSLNAIKGLRETDRKVKFISLSRNFGHQSALFAGMSYSSGDAVITMDVDLQHPPALIPEMIKLWREGTEVVYTRKRNANLSFMDFCFFSVFYWLMSKISGLELSFGQSDFRLIDKKVLKVILGIPEYHKFLRGQIKWVGFKQKALYYDVAKRLRGAPKYTYRKRLAFAMDGIFAFSRYPLRLITMTGIAISILSSLFIVFILLVWLLDRLHIIQNVIVPPGWATLVVAVFFLGSIQLIAIGIIGEYIGRIYDQTKGRPIFIVKEASDQIEG